MADKQRPKKTNRAFPFAAHKRAIPNGSAPNGRANPPRIYPQSEYNKQKNTSDTYSENEIVLSYEEWSEPTAGIANGLTVVIGEEE